MQYGFVDIYVIFTDFGLYERNYHMVYSYILNRIVILKYDSRDQ